MMLFKPRPDWTAIWRTVKWLWRQGAGLLYVVLLVGAYQFGKDVGYTRGARETAQVFMGLLDRMEAHDKVQPLQPPTEAPKQ